MQLIKIMSPANYGISNYLVGIAQNTLSKNATRVKNSHSFVQEAKTWKVTTDEVQVSYDVVNLYPSVPIKEATEVIVDMLNKDSTDLKQYTKLKIPEIKSLIDTCLSKCYFLWNDEIHELENSGPIGLSLMVVMAEAYLQFLEGKAINEALHVRPTIDLKTFRRYVDDSHSRFPKIENATKFKEILNKQDKRIQYTMETENEGKTLPFLDIKVINNGDGKYEFDLFRKTAITNVQVKPTSSHDPKILEGIFKGFVHRAHKICSEKHLKGELEFLTNVFMENGYEEKTLRQIVKDVATKINRDNAPQSDEPTEETNLPTVTLPWIPGVSTKLKKVYRKAGYKVAFKSNRNIQAILTKKNKVQLPPNSYPGVYRITCGCPQPPYIGQTKIRICSRNVQHEDYVRKEQWKKSGAAQHSRVCPTGTQFKKTETIKMEHNRFDRIVREALEIQKHRSGPKQGGTNFDDGQYLNNTFWVPLMDHISKEEEDKRRRMTSNTMTSNQV